jgi:hypothetical protein
MRNRSTLDRKLTMMVIMQLSLQATYPSDWQTILDLAQWIS